MDYDQAETTLREYEQRVNEYKELAEQDAIFPVLRMPARRVNSVLAGLNPDHRRVTGKTLNDHVAALALVQEARAVISAGRDMNAAEDKLGQPTLPMALLESLIYEAAIKHWGSGHYRIAVGEAATNLERFAQRRLDRSDASGSALMESAFSSSPPEPGKPRLHCPGDHLTQSVKSRQTGAQAYAKACFAIMRNPAHHEKGDWNPVTAFHYLVSLSQVAWWVRTWDVKVHVPPNA